MMIPKSQFLSDDFKPSLLLGKDVGWHAIILVTGHRCWFLAWWLTAQTKTVQYTEGLKLRSVVPNTLTVVSQNQN